MGLAFLPIPGLQYDEILFLHPFLYDWALFRHQILGQEIPLMVMSYVGALKTWLYWPLYTWLPPSVWVVRLPMLLVGCLNVWLIYRLGRRLWSPRAGLVAAALAATDPTFLLTHVFDWGPVALQVLLTLCAALAFLQWRDTGLAKWLGLCGFCCGLALWNKAIFVWILIGVAVAAPLCWPGLLLVWRHAREIRRHTLAYVLAAFCFVVGAAPFLAYNIDQAGKTATDNARFESSFPSHKLPVAWYALDGSIIATAANISAVWAESCVLSPAPEWTGASPLPASLSWFPQKTFTGQAFCLAALALVLGWRAPGARIGRFLLMVLLIHCALAMASIAGGTGLHHYAPALPLVFLAIGGAWDLLYRWTPPGLGSLKRVWRVALVAAAILLPVQASLSLCGWWQRTSACGGRHIWSDASRSLGAWVRTHPEEHFYATDWGIDPQAIYFSEKLGHMRFLGPLTDEPATSGPQFEEIQRIFSDPKTRLIGFQPGLVVMAHYRERVDTLAALHGYRIQEENSITDSYGRPVYLVWRLVASPDASEQ